MVALVRGAVLRAGTGACPYQDDGCGVLLAIFVSITNGKSGAEGGFWTTPQIASYDGVFRKHVRALSHILSTSFNLRHGFHAIFFAPPRFDYGRSSVGTHVLKPSIPRVSPLDLGLLPPSPSYPPQISDVVRPCGSVFLLRLAGAWLPILADADTTASFRLLQALAVRFGVWPASALDDCWLLAAQVTGPLWFVKGQCLHQIARRTSCNTSHRKHGKRH